MSPFQPLSPFQPPTGYTQVIAEKDSSGNVQAAYAWGQQLISQARTGGTTSVYLYDGHGNVRALANTSGAVTDTYIYDAFGNLTASTGSTPNVYLYADERFDSTLGEYDLRSRNYSPTQGRFSSQDSYSPVPGDLDNADLYVYGSDNAANTVDPLGMAGTFMANLGTAIHEGVYDLYDESHAGRLEYNRSPEGWGGLLRPDIADYALHQIGEVKPLSMYGLGGFPKLAFYIHMFNGGHVVINDKSYVFNPVDNYTSWTFSRWPVGIRPIPITDPYYVDWAAVTLGNVAGVIFYKAYYKKNANLLTAAALVAMAKRLAEQAEQWMKEIQDSVKPNSQSPGGSVLAPVPVASPSPGLIAAFSTWLATTGQELMAGGARSVNSIEETNMTNLIGASASVGLLLYGLGIATVNSSMGGAE
jgi:RHS repeat-associated protein